MAYAFLVLLFKYALRDGLRDGLMPVVREGLRDGMREGLMPVVREGLMPVVEVGGAKALENGLKPVVLFLLVGVVAVDTLWRIYRKFGW